MSEHDFEPIRGLPGRLPEGERILWQGEPDWRLLAVHVFHVRAIALYFLALMAWRTYAVFAGGADVWTAMSAGFLFAPLAALTLGVLTLIAFLMARTTVYTLTNKRLVLRHGLALTKAVNVPYAVVDAAAVKRLDGGGGDLALHLKPGHRLGYLHLWPHTRPFKFASPEPTLRSIKDADAPANILARALRETHGANAAPARREEPGAATAPGAATPLGAA